MLWQVVFVYIGLQVFVGLVGQWVDFDVDVVFVFKEIDGGLVVGLKLFLVCDLCVKIFKCVLKWYGFVQVIVGIGVKLMQGVIGVFEIDGVIGGVDYLYVFKVQMFGQFLLIGQCFGK